MRGLIFARKLDWRLAASSVPHRLNENFKNGAYHLSLVTHKVEVGGGKTNDETVGIITLEDIIEEIICDEIVDETDKYINNKVVGKKLRKKFFLHKNFYIFLVTRTEHKA